MLLNKTIDPRDDLERLGRLQLVQLAHSRGQTDITEAMSAVDIRKELKSRGVRPGRVNGPALGTTGRHERSAIAPKQMQPQPAPELSPAEMQEFRAWQAQQRAAAMRAQRASPGKTLSEMSINELRDLCKKSGVKMDRGDNTHILREKLKAHGENPPELRQ